MKNKDSLFLCYLKALISENLIKKFTVSKVETFVFFNKIMKKLLQNSIDHMFFNLTKIFFPT